MAVDDEDGDAGGDARPGMSMTERRPLLDADGGRWGMFALRRRVKGQLRNSEPA